MEEENINLKQLSPFNGKEDILSAFLIKNTNNNINVNEKSFQEDFFFKPEQNYLDEYFGNENKSNTSFSLYKYNNSNDYHNYNTMKTSRKSSYENIQIKNEYKLNNPMREMVQDHEIYGNPNVHCNALGFRNGCLARRTGHKDSSGNTQNDTVYTRGNVKRNLHTGNIHRSGLG